MNIRFWLKRPKMALARIRYWLWERANPDKPWMCPDTVKFCQAHLSKSMAALEFGSGRGTRWLATHVGHLISVEHNAEWYKAVQRQLADAGDKNVDYRLVPLSHPKSEGERPEYSPVPDYVAVADGLEDRSIDFAVVDGHYRTHCVRHLIPKIAPRGYLVVDDVNFWPSLAALRVPEGWSVVDDSTNGIKRCIIWQAGEAADTSDAARM
jgi:predicted O-methyltransferase YrrM